MIKQAHTYLVGALSGVTLIGIAIAVFVVLVSAQVFQEWPTAEVSSHQRESALAPAKALPVGVGATTATTTGRVTGKAARSRAGDNGAATTATPTVKSGANHGGTATDPGAI